MKLYIGNLAYSVTETDIRELISQYGEANSIKLITDKHTGESKGFGFIEMDDNSAADAMIKALNDTQYKGRRIKVNQAKPKSDKPRRGNY